MKNTLLVLAALTLGTAAFAGQVGRPDVVQVDFGVANATPTVLTNSYLYGNVTIAEELYRSPLNGQLVGSLKVGNDWIDRNVIFGDVGLTYNNLYNGTPYSIYGNVRHNFLTCVNTCESGTGTRARLGVNIRF